MKALCVCAVGCSTLASGVNLLQKRSSVDTDDTTEGGLRTAKTKVLWRPYIETGVLEEHLETNAGQTFSNSPYRLKRRVYLPERTADEDPLHRLQLTQTVKSPFTVEECANLEKLSLAKRNELAKGGGKFCILAFGKALLVASKNMDLCNMRQEFMYAANLVGQNLDLDWDGKIDDAKVGDALDATRETGSVAPIFMMGCNKSEEVPEEGLKFDRLITGEPQGAQVWSGHPFKTTLIEETFHWAHDGAWAWVYPNLVGYAGHPNVHMLLSEKIAEGAKASSLAKCHKHATCEFWMHPENSGCSNAAGVACANPDKDYGVDENVTKVAGYPASSLKPGACAAKPGTCADAACDLDEFFHKIYMAIIGETRCVAYRYVKASGGKEPTLDWSQGCFDRSILNDMAQSTECAAFLEELKTEAGVGKTYKIPATKYSDNYSIGGDPSSATSTTTSTASPWSACITDETKNWPGYTCVFKNNCGTELAVVCDFCPGDEYYIDKDPSEYSSDGCFVKMCQGFVNKTCTVKKWQQ